MAYIDSNHVVSVFIEFLYLYNTRKKQQKIWSYHIACFFYYYFNPTLGRLYVAVGTTGELVQLIHGHVPAFNWLVTLIWTWAREKEVLSGFSWSVAWHVLFACIFYETDWQGRFINVVWYRGKTSGLNLTIISRCIILNHKKIPVPIFRKCGLVHF